jgi:hypothetical protein
LTEKTEGWSKEKQRNRRVKVRDRRLTEKTEGWSKEKQSSRSR